MRANAKKSAAARITIKIRNEPELALFRADVLRRSKKSFVILHSCARVVICANENLLLDSEARNTWFDR